MRSQNYFTRAYDDSSEAFWCTEYNAKNPDCFKGTVLEINQEKLPEILVLGSFFFIIVFFNI